MGQELESTNAMGKDLHQSLDRALKWAKVILARSSRVPRGKQQKVYTDFQQMYRQVREFTRPRALVWEHLVRTEGGSTQATSSEEYFPEEVEAGAADCQQATVPGRFESKHGGKFQVVREDLGQNEFEIQEQPHEVDIHKQLQKQFRKTTTEFMGPFLKLLLNSAYNFNRTNIKEVEETQYSQILNKTQFEDQKNEDSQVEPIPQNDWVMTDEKNLRESGKVKIIEMMAQIKNFVVLIRKTEQKAVEIKGETSNDEYTMYVFEEGKTEPIFSYVITKGCVPLTLDGVVFTNEKQGNKEELQVLMTVRDNNQGGKICLQYVLVAHKKFKNMMYSTACLPGSSNFVRVRSLRNGDFDLMLNVGQTKFVYLRYPRTDTEWYNSIRDNHVMHNLYPPSEAMNRECVDFRHEVYSQDEQNSTVAFLVRADTFYTLIFTYLNFDELSKKWKFNPLKTIEDFTSQSTIYSSLIWDSRQNIATLIGIKFTKKSDMIKTKLNICSKIFESVSVSTCADQTNDINIDETNLTKFDANSTRYETIDTFAPLDYTQEDLNTEIKNKNPTDIEVFIQNFIENIPIRAVTEPVFFGPPGCQTPRAVASLLVAGQEHVLYRLLQTDRNPPVLNSLVLGDCAFTEEAEGRRTAVSSVVALGDRQLEDQGLATYALSASKGLLARVAIRLPPLPPDVKRPVDKYLDHSHNRSFLH